MNVNDFTHWAFTLSGIYTIDSGHKLMCDLNVENKDYSYCRFEGQKCSDIPAKDFTMDLYDDDGNSFTMTTSTDDFFVDGENFGHQKNTYCYLPAFRYGLSSADDTD